jgi:hypothetical protein
MKSFIVSNKGIAFEDFDEEIVVVNLPVGYYYSMKGTARKLFLQAVNGTNQNNLAKYIVANYDLALTEALAFTEQFIEKLYNNQLVVEISPIEDIHYPEATVKTSFENPSIEIYDDMQELLSLDPIHDVDSVQGWPLKK